MDHSMLALLPFRKEFLSDVKAKEEEMWLCKGWLEMDTKDKCILKKEKGRKRENSQGGKSETVPVSMYQNH